MAIARCTSEGRRRAPSGDRESQGAGGFFRSCLSRSRSGRSQASLPRSVFSSETGLEQGDAGWPLLVISQVLSPPGPPWSCPSLPCVPRGRQGAHSPGKRSRSTLCQLSHAPLLPRGGCRPTFPASPSLTRFWASPLPNPDPPALSLLGARNTPDSDHGILPFSPLCAKSGQPLHKLKQNPDSLSKSH